MRVAKIKGTQLVGIARSLREYPRHLKPLMPAHCQHYFDEPIVVTAWYPEVDYAALLVTLGRWAAPRIQEPDVWRFLGREGAKTDLAGPYASLVREGNPMGTIQRATYGWTLFHDTGRVNVTVQGAREVSIEIHDYSVMCVEIAACNAGYFEQVLLAAGAIEPTVTIHECSKSHIGPTVLAARWQ